MTYANRFLPVIHGERNTGQRSIEIAVWGPLDTSEADQALKRELPKIIKVNRATGQ